MKNKPNIMQAWAIAARLRTLPIPTIQVLTGTALAYAIKGSIDWILLLFTWLVAIFITMGTNLINDVIDFDNGEEDSKRVGFLKVISAGIIPRKHVWLAGMICFALTIFFGFLLTLQTSWFIFFIVLASVICGYCYTGGPYPISYLGLSEVFILIFYGFVCVGASYYVQTGHVSVQALLCALQMGLLAILPNALNNLRDMHEDAENQKFTLAVRYGKDFAYREIALLTYIPFFLGLIWLFLGYPTALIPIFLIPIAFIFVRGVKTTDSGPLFNRLFGMSVLVHFLFGACLMLGFLL
jgi:1,4-dihydroxy-2-naphthoate octaprenyltransferase